MDFPSLICDFCQILFPIPYHSIHVTGNVFQSILPILHEVEEEEICVTTLLEDKYLQQVNLCYRPEAKMAAINNIEIFGLVCREANPPIINIQQVFNF
jgi:hypothetical protein